MTVEATRQQIIINTIGDRNQLLSTNVPIIWEMYADIGVYAPRLQYLQTLRDALVMMQGYVRNLVDFGASGDLRVSLSQRFDHLQKMLESVNAQIEQQINSPYIEFSAGVDQLITTQPSYPPTDEEARALRGDAYRGKRIE